LHLFVLLTIAQAPRCSHRLLGISPVTTDLALSAGLQTRFERTGQLADLDAAIAAGRDAMAATSPDHPMYLSNLGVKPRLSQLAGRGEKAVFPEQRAVETASIQTMSRPVTESAHSRGALNLTNAVWQRAAGSEELEGPHL
jgi:hypothetical protein